MRTIDLSGIWKVKYTDPGMGDETCCREGLLESEGWFDCSVPGMVHEYMEKNGLIDDVHFADNASRCSWIEAREWWYIKSFTVNERPAKSKAILNFDGLDTFGKVWLNGVLLGEFNNMFIKYRYDVTDLLKPGENFLCLKFDSIDGTIKNLGDVDYNLEPFCAFNLERIYLRKMQCSFGWDWSSRLASTGIWKDVRLLFADSEIVDVFAKTQHISRDRCFSLLEVELDHHNNGGEKNLVISVENEGQLVYKNKLILKENQERLEHEFEIENPKLWWPNGMGEPNLYKVTVELEDNGEVVEEKVIEYGIRTVRLKLKDGKKSCFYFEINGRKVFCKGANWVPADNFPSRITADRYKKLIEYARDCNFNMLRVWGGGIYESPEFYNACDKMGIMVWQDFMFACAHYPEDSNFITAVREETEQVVKNLRNHASIVLWCGNNECGMNFNLREEYSGKIIFEQVIKNICADLDDTRPYRPSSPYGDGINVDIINNSPETGDWHGGSWYEYYNSQQKFDYRDIISKQDCTFVSELYAMSTPCIDSLRKFIPNLDQWPFDKRYLEFHTRDNPYSGFDNTSFEILEKIAERMFNQSKDIDEFVYKSMLVQGIFLKEEIEHYRRNRDCGGALFWMYNDIWPAISWSIIDYYLNPKLSYYYVRKAFAPVLLSFKKESGNSAGVYIINDRCEELKVDLELTKGDGSFLSAKVDKGIILPPNSSSYIKSIHIEQGMPADTWYIAGRLICNGDVISDNLYCYTDSPGDIKLLKDVAVKKDIIKVHNNQYFLKLKADEFVSIVELKGGSSIVFSDNYFSLVPGLEKCISIEGNNFKEEDLSLYTWNY